MLALAAAVPFVERLRALLVDVVFDQPVERFQGDTGFDILFEDSETLGN